MKLHARHFIVKRAGINIERTITKEIEERDITVPELLTILSPIISRYADVLLKQERGEIG